MHNVEAKQTVPFIAIQVENPAGGCGTHFYFNAFMSVIVHIALSSSNELYT
jgi:hypothetical protein